MSHIMSDTVPHILLVVLLVFFAGFLFFLIFKIIKTTKEWQKNNKAPVEELAATVVSKRVSATFGKKKMEGADSGNFHVRFELENGKTEEFHVFEEQYAAVEVGDSGVLHRQGTRFLGFEKK